jgi:hypothetical protein
VSRSPDSICAVNWVAETRRVVLLEGSGAPGFCQRILEFASKLDPTTVRVNPGAPCKEEVGVISVRTGATARPVAERRITSRRAVIQKRFPLNAVPLLPTIAPPSSNVPIDLVE